MEAGRADHVWAIEEIVALLVSERTCSCASSGYASRRKNFQERLRKRSGRSSRSSKSCVSVRPQGVVMKDEWTKVISGDRIVKFTYVDLPGENAFLTAQIAGHEVVYSVLLGQAEYPFNREGVHFDYERPPISH
jgi:hypothetical protein